MSLTVKIIANTNQLPGKSKEVLFLHVTTAAGDAVAMEDAEAAAERRGVTLGPILYRFGATHYYATIEGNPNANQRPS